MAWWARRQGSGPMFLRGAESQPISTQSVARHIQVRLSNRCTHKPGDVHGLHLAVYLPVIAECGRELAKTTTR